jgi:hypothetical protein
VLAAIYFNDQPLLEANEVDDELVYWCLAAEVISAPFHGAQLNPELDFLRCHALAQGPCSLICQFCSPGAAIPPHAALSFSPATAEDP